MNPIKIDLIEKKKQLIIREIGLLQQLVKKRIGKASDLETQHVLCRSMQNCITAVIDIAQHIVSEKGGEVPPSYSECVAALGPLGILDSKFAIEFSRIAKLRNVLVHQYDDLDIGFLASLVPKLIDDLKTFLRVLDKF